MNLAGFAETVYQNGIEKKQKKKELKFQILMQESMFMECPILNGKKISKINIFSFK